MIRLQKAHRRDISHTHSPAKERTSAAISPRGDDEIAPEACFRTPAPMSGFSQNSNCSKDYNSNLNAYLAHSFASKFRNNYTPNLNDCDLNSKRNFVSNRMRNSAKNHVRNSVPQLRGRGTSGAVMEALFGGAKFYELKSIFARESTFHSCGTRFFQIYTYNNRATNDNRPVKFRLAVLDESILTS